MHRIQITEPARADIEDAFQWWSDKHSPDQAALWYERIFDGISTLNRMPERCPLVPESALSISGVRQLHFGVGNHPTHRIIFVIESDVVTILRVRHHAQDDLGPGDIAQ